MLPKYGHIRKQYVRKHDNEETNTNKEQNRLYIAKQKVKHMLHESDVT